MLTKLLPENSASRGLLDHIADALLEVINGQDWKSLAGTGRLSMALRPSKRGDFLEHLLYPAQQEIPQRMGYSHPFD